MAVYRCLHCEKLEPNDETHNNLNYVTFTDDARFDPEVKCAHCGRGGLVCNHNGAYFDRAKQSFICYDCGEETGKTAKIMATLRQIDRTKSLSFCGYKAAKVTEPEMVALAAKMNLPQMLVCDEPVADGMKVAPDDAVPLLDRMAEREWRALFETDLQCVSEDAEGRPFLTTWLSLDVFRQFVESIADLRVHSTFAISLREWESKGAQKIYVDGYQLV